MTRRSLDELQTSTDWSMISKRLRRMALALTRSAADADDLAQQTLVTLLVKRPDRAAHVGYGRRVMVRLWLDQQRSLRRRVARLVGLARLARPYHEDDDRLSVNDRYQKLYRAIDSLPARQRAVLVLRLVEELDYAEIAETLGCSVQSVRANLHLGRQRVRELTGETP